MTASESSPPLPPSLSAAARAAAVRLAQVRARTSNRVPLEEVARRGELKGSAAIGCATAGFLLPGIACGVVGMKFGAVMSGSVGSGGGLAFDWLLVGALPGALLGALIGWLLPRWERVVSPSELAWLDGREDVVPEQFRG